MSRIKKVVANSGSALTRRHTSSPSSCDIIQSQIIRAGCICCASLGQPFDLQKKLPELRDFEENDEERGRGLQIMFAIADHLSYEPQAENRYCLLIRKSY